MMIKGMIMIAPDSCNAYLTPGDGYEVKKVINDSQFIIIDDDGEEILCRTRNCQHLHGGNWIGHENTSENRS